MKKIMIAAVTILSLLMLFSCAKKEESAKVYVFATDATWPPLEYIDESGNLTGFEVELVPMIGEKVGVKMEAKNIPWDTIFAGLANGQYDGVASGVSVTEDRKKTMDFSTPILQAGKVMIVRNDSKVKGAEDMKGLRVGVQIGTTGDLVLDDYDVTRKQYDDIGLAIQDMLNGNLDACVCDSLIASDYVLANENYKNRLKVAGEPFTEEDIAIAVKKGNSELLGLVNKGLEMMKADGSYDALKAKWNLL